MVQRAYELPVAASKVAEMLDGGQYRRAEKLLANHDAPDDPLLCILRAEVEIYFTRLDQGARWLDRVQPNLAELSIPAAARYGLIRGELHYSRYEDAEAKEQFLTAQQIYKLLGDSFHLANCLCRLAGLKRRQADYPKAQSLLGRARELIRSESPEQIERFEFLSGLIDFNEGECHHRQGDFDRASALYASAVELLRRSEEGRFFANALNGHGLLLLRLGQYQESFEALQSSSRILAELAALGDLEESRSNLARAMIKLRQYAEAEEILKEGAEFARRTGDVDHTALCFELFAELYFEKGELESARRYIGSAIEYADLGHHAERKCGTRILAGRIALARGDTRAAEAELTRALDVADASQNSTLRARVCLYLAEAALATSTVKGQEYLAQASELLTRHHDASLELDFKRISGRYRGERISVTTDNKLTINGHLLPTWNAAKEAVERFLLKNAIDQAGGNQAKAGEILGISKVHVHDKRKQYGL